MARETRLEIAWSAKAHGFLYVRSDHVAVVSVIGQRETSSEPLRSALQACVARFEPLLHAWLRALPQDRILLFVATPPSYDHNAASRHRGVWGTDDLRWLPATVARSPSVEIAGSDGRQRFAGLAEIPEASFFEAADFARTHGGSFLLVSPRDELSGERVRSMVAEVFPKDDSALDWANVVALVEQGEDVCIRPGGGFDDREVSIEAFLSDELLRRLPAPGGAEQARAYWQGQH